MPADWPSMHTELRGEQGPLVVFLHGFLGRGDDWLPVHHAFDGGIRSLFVDLPGHGQSTGFSDSMYDFGRTVLELAELIHEKCGGKPCHLAGYSLGGRLALRLALDYPRLFKAVLVESATPGIEDDAARFERLNDDEALAEVLEKSNMVDFLKEWYGQPLFASLAEKPQLLGPLISRRAASSNPIELAKALRGMSTGRQQPLWARLGGLNVPVTAIFGQLDEKFALVAARMAGLSNNIKAVRISGSGHNTHLENPGDFLGVFRRFLNLES